MSVRDGEEQRAAQRAIARDAVASLRMVSKTFMVDAYREVVNPPTITQIIL